MQELPAWVRAWNDARKTDAYFGKVWDRVLPAAAYAVQGPDDAPGEDKDTAGLGNTLPKTVDGGEKKPGTRFYEAFENTPFSNEVLADFTEATIEGEQLGRRAKASPTSCASAFPPTTTSATCGGPDSHEIMDNVVRMDRTLAEFFQFLDAHVGLKRCTIILTADHGVSPMPETVHRINPSIPAGRTPGADTVAPVGAALDRAFGPLADKSAWFVRDDTALLFYPAALQEKKITAAAAEAVACEALRKLDFIQAAYTRDQLEKGDVNDRLGHSALLSFNRARGADVYFQTKPYYFSKATGSSHGTPYNYDTHVPLVWFGVGVKPGLHPEQVFVDDLAPTLAHLLGLPAPPFAEGRVLF